MNATRIAPIALYQEVAERLRQRIFSHELPPGTSTDTLRLSIPQVMHVYENLSLPL